MKTLIALALAGATLAAAGGAVAGSGNLDARMSPVASARPAPTHLIPTRTCKWPRISVRKEYFKLQLAGYRKIKYLGKSTFLPRCAKFFYFSACKGSYRYRLIVRYIKFTRYVVVLPKGYCYTIHPLGAFKR